MGYIKQGTADKTKPISVMLTIIAVISNLSQIPPLSGMPFTKVLILLLWIFLFIYIITSFKVKFALFGVVASVLLFDVYILILQLVTGKDALGSVMVYPLHVALFYFAVSYCIGYVCEERILYPMARGYVISTVVIVVYIYMNYFFGKKTLDSLYFVYSSKNSAAFIVLTGGILLSLPGLFKSRTLKFAILAAFVVFIFLLKSRATIFCTAAIAVMAAFIFIRKKKYKLLILGIFIGAACIIYFNDTAYDIVINKIIFNNRAGAGLDAITSNRATHFRMFTEMFSASPLFGNGFEHIESFPLSVLANYGAVGFVPLFIFILTPFFVYFRVKKSERYVKNILAALFIISVLNGIFEEQSPLGPGVKCYMLWLMSGFYHGYSHKKINL